MTAFRVLAFDVDGRPDPARADVLAQVGDTWHVVARCRGLDAEARAQDMRRMLEAGLLVLGRDLPGGEVAAEDHPAAGAWLPLGEAAVLLGDPLRVLVTRIAAGKLRAYDTPTGPHVHAADVAAVLEARRCR